MQPIWRDLMIDRGNNTKRLIFALAGGAIASLIAFLASPLSVQLLGERKFAQLSIWILLVTFVQILDFGFSQITTQRCTHATQYTEKQQIILENNSIFLLLICILAPLSLLIPKPVSPTYITITEAQWIIFKISIILNLKVVYNQNALVIRNYQNDFTILQNVVVFSRFILPIFVYYMTENFTSVLFCFLASTVIIILTTDLRLGLKWRLSFDLASTTSIVRRDFKRALHLYTSGAFAITLGVADRIIASYIFDLSTFAQYVATFTLASAVNIVVLPFYRFFIGGIRSFSREYNRKNAMRISAVQSYACLLAVCFICLYGIQVIEALGLLYPLDLKLLVIFTFSLWGAANGWIIAAEIMLHSRPAFQAKLIAVTMILYGLYLLVIEDPKPLDLAMIWAIHGVVQTLVCPLWISEKFRLARYTRWLAQVVLKPSLAVGVLVFLSCSAGWLNTWLSPAVFLTGTLLLAFLVVRGGTLEKLA